jgi:hypothetical protein
MRSCSRLTFFDIERAHWIFRGVANTHFLLLFTPRAGLNLCTSSRKAWNGFRMWPHCSRRLSARLRSKGTACSAFRCWSDRESVPRNDNVSWKLDEAPPESCSAVVIWCTNFRVEMMSPADHPKDIASKFCGISESKETTRGLKAWDGWTWRSWWGEWGSLVHGGVELKPLDYAYSATPGRPCRRRINPSSTNHCYTCPSLAFSQLLHPWKSN